MNNNNNNNLAYLFKKYNLSFDEQNYLVGIINPIMNHMEFQIRMGKEFPHHGSISLGEHILEDAVVTYLLSKKYLEKKKNDNYHMDLAIKIAMLHDLYTLPWQNNPKANVHHFWNKHGFRHPIESVINSLNWYPDLFHDDEEAKIIIDGIIHHMYPLPVRKGKINKIDKLELKNMDLYVNLDKNKKSILEENLFNGKGFISFRRSKYLEGRIMSKADKIVSRKQIKDFSSAKSLITGHNKKIK